MYLYLTEFSQMSLAASHLKITLTNIHKMKLNGPAGVTYTSSYSQKHDLSVCVVLCDDNVPALDFFICSCTSAVRQRFPRLLKLVGQK